MLSNKVINYCKKKEWYFNQSSLDQEEFSKYQDVLLKIGISLESDIAQFYLSCHSVPTFFNDFYAEEEENQNDDLEAKEIYHLCWNILNTDYLSDLEPIRNFLCLSKEYIPLSNFEGEYGFFYNIKTGEVLDLELGQQTIDLENGKSLKPQWKDFNSFMEWYFGIDKNEEK